MYYKYLVQKETDLQPISQLENYDKRGHSGISGSYNLAHIISLKYGYENNISPDIIGDIRNLRFIPWKQNLSKSSKQVVESEEMIQYFIENEYII